MLIRRLREPLAVFFHWQYSGWFIAIFVAASLAVWGLRDYAPVYVFLCVAGVWALLYWQYSRPLGKRYSGYKSAKAKSNGKPDSLPKLEKYRKARNEYFLWNLVGSVPIVALTACGVLWIRANQLSYQQDDAFNGLSGKIELPDSKVNMNSTFTVTNNGHFEIGQYTLYCQIIRGESPHNHIHLGAVTSGPLSKTPIEPGGDADSWFCVNDPGLHNYAFGLAGGPNQSLACMDVRFGIQYSLSNQPNNVKEKLFRYVSEEGRDFSWQQESLSAQVSPCDSPVFNH
jgi:hypothetical protein